MCLGIQEFHLSTPTHATCVEVDSDRACGDDRGLRYADIVTGLTSPNASRRVRVSGRSPGSRVDVKSSRPHLPVPRAQWFFAVSGSLTVAWAAPDSHPPSGRSPVSRFSPGKLNFPNHLRRQRAYADESGGARDVTWSLLPKESFECIERGRLIRGGGRAGADPAFGVRVIRPRRASSSRGWALGAAQGDVNVICGLDSPAGGSIIAAEERVDRVTLGGAGGPGMWDSCSSSTPCRCSRRGATCSCRCRSPNARAARSGTRAAWRSSWLGLADRGVRQTDCPSRQGNAGPEVRAAA